MYLKKLLGTGGSRLGLSANDKITVGDLLYGLMMVSGNDAAVALSEFIGGSIEGFATLMNQKASVLGLNSTHFVTPHGLDQDEHYTTAYELAKLADYALQNTTFAKIVNTSNCIINVNGKPKSLHNTNELLGYLDGVYGVKTGFTNGANRCLVSSCKRGDLDIICVVLGCDTKKFRTLDSINLINYTFDNFSVVNLQNIIEKNFDDWCPSIYIEKAVSQDIELYLDKSQIKFENIAINNNSLDNIYTSITFSDYHVAPLLSGTIVGKMEVFINYNLCFSVDILNKNTVKRKNLLDYLSDFATCYFDCFNI